MATELILAVNAGSSSVKASLFQASASTTSDITQLADAEISGLSYPPATFKYERGSEKVKGKQVKDVSSQADGFKYVLNYLLSDDGLTQLKDKQDIRYVCHRIVHGGDYGSTHILDQETYHRLEELSDLAPLHNGAGLAIVKVAHSEIPAATNVAYFDSGFHQTIPKHISTYAISPEVASRNKLRKYGFHGISYAFILKAVAKYLGKEPGSTNLIALHLGSGASACAIRDGKSLDTSMGLTPVAGLPGGTRSGDVDPSLVFHYTHDAGKPSPNSTKELHITRAEEILNKESGFKALTGTSDFGKISESSDEKCKLAVDLFVDRVTNFIGSYYVKLGGRVDALVFAGGIGEKGSDFRERVVKQCSCLGFDIDPKKNGEAGDDTVSDIGSSSAKHRTLLCYTDEQFEMARGCIEAAQSLKESGS